MAERSVVELILDLRQMHINGARDDELCSRGTEIYERLEKDYKLAGNNTRRIGVINAEKKAFEAVIAKIRNGRHQHALDAYDAFVAKRTPKGKGKK